MPGQCTLRALRLSVHSWELPSWPASVLRPATSGALKLVIAAVYPECRVEVDFDSVPDSPVLNPYTGRPSWKGAKVEFDVTGGTFEERHLYQHIVANVLEGLMRRTLQLFIERDAINRFQQRESGYKHYEREDEPDILSFPILT